MRWAVLVLIAGCAQASPREQQDAPPVQIDAASDATVDAAAVCAMQPCDIQTQCGCSANQACDIDTSDLMGNACRNKLDTGIEGQTCGGPAACAKKYVCIGSGSNRSCERYCASDAECIAPRGQCVIQITGNGQPFPGATTCSSNCDPASTTNALCPSTWTCDLFTATFMGTDHQIADCRKAGAATQGQTCSASIACATGLSCVTLSTGGSQCAKICVPPSNTGCPGGTTCTAFSTPFTVGGTSYGACL